MRKTTSKAVFKQYIPSQVLLLPPNLEDLIPQHHLVRVVNIVVEQMDITAIINQYEGGGTSAYHPRMMVKVMLYAYAMKIYTGRRIAKALREDINFMWLAAYNRPDFRTINNFRSGILKDTIEDLFKSMLVFLMDNSYIKFENYFCDGSTFSANANRHKMVWKKNAVRYQEAAEQNCRTLFKQIDELNSKEETTYGNLDLEETGSEQVVIDSNSIKEQIIRLQEVIEQTTEKRKKRKAAGLQKKLQEQKSKINKYKRQQSTSGNRSGYSKTDNDATAMMMKNEEILPAYNVMIGSEDQFIINYSVHQNPNDATCFKDHLEQLEKHTGENPDYIIADSVFGTEENYELIEEKEIGNLMKFPLYHKEQTHKYKNNPFNRDNFAYDAQSDTYSCPNGKRLYYKGNKNNKNRNGYQSISRLYECESCQGCPFAAQCYKSEDKNKTIAVNENLERYKQQARQNLNTAEGNKLKRKRGQEVESCFGDLKMNQGFRRFHLRGKQKVKSEFGIISIAHNLRKIHLKQLAKVA
jgi:transposase